MSPYDVLGVAPTATDQEIRKVYVELARRHHPDYFTEADPRERAEADRRMRQINEAWQVLGDPDRRAAYDRDRRLGAASRSGGADGSGRSSVVSSAPKRAWRPVEPDDPDEPDPRDLVDDTPIGDGNKPPKAIPLLVTVLFFTAIASFCVGMVSRAPGLLAAGVVLAALAGLALVAAPAIALSKSWSNERASDASRRPPSR